LTEDHKPNLPEEKKRIEKAGGQVVFDGYMNYRVYAKGKTFKGRRYPGLNMSRSMGDLLGNYDAGVSAVPEVSKVPLSSNGQSEQSPDGPDLIGAVPSVSSHSIDPMTDHFILLCSDGVWEFISSDEAVAICADHGPNQAMVAAESLSRESWDRWMQNLGGQVVDDITAMIVHLNYDKKVATEVDAMDTSIQQSASEPQSPKILDKE